MVAKHRFPKNVIKPVWNWSCWCVWGANNEAVVDFSLVLLMFRETWCGSFWRVFGPMDSHDFRVCDFAWFYYVFWMILVCWGGLKGWNVDPRGGFKAKVDNQDSTSWWLHFGGFGWCRIAFSFKNHSKIKQNRTPENHENPLVRRPFKSPQIKFHETF